MVYFGWRSPWRGGSTDHCGHLSYAGWGDDEHGRVWGPYGLFPMEKWCQDMQSSLELYPAEGRMISPLEILVDGAVNGLRVLLAKNNYLKWKHLIFIQYYWKTWILERKMGGCMPVGAWKKYFFGNKMWGIAFVRHGILLMVQFMFCRMDLLISYYGPPKFRKRAINMGLWP